MSQRLTAHRAAQPQEQDGFGGVVEWLMSTWLIGASILVFCVLAALNGTVGMGFGMIVVVTTVLTVLLHEKRQHDAKSNDQSRTEREVPSDVPTQLTKLVAALFGALLALICLWEFVNWWFGRLF